MKKLTLGLSLALLLVSFSETAFAGQTTFRTGPKGNSLTTNRSAGNGQQVTTRTGSGGKTQTTVRAAGNGSQTTTRIGPNGGVQQTTRTINK
jgi:hypothetical protein